MLDPIAIRGHFPLLPQQIDGHPLIYLDSAATAQKPRAVLEAMTRFYERDNGNAHRGMHPLAERATVAFEESRKTVQRFLRAARPEEIVFTRGTTESINLVAHSWGRNTLKKGDVVLLTRLEHHSNVVPWLQLKEDIGIEIAWIDIDDVGRLRLEQLHDALSAGNAKLLCITGESNVLGIRPPLETIIPLAHQHGALVLVDAAQSIVHVPTDVEALDCDFLAFSGHKLYGPMGIGVLYGKRILLETMPPFLGGGMMIQSVRDDGFSSTEIPHKFEAGTQPIAEAVGLAAAIDWLEQFSWDDIITHERALLEKTIDVLQSIPRLKILGPGKIDADIAGCVSFVIDGIHAHDLTEILGRKGICLRAGHHCTQPLHRRLGVTASSRVSVGIYNTMEEIESLPQAIEHAVQSLH